MGRVPPRLEGDLFGDLPPTVAWVSEAGGWLALLDQTLLPGQVKVRACHDAEQVRTAICELCVRGAPAIGVAGAYGLCLATRDSRMTDPATFQDITATAAQRLKSARPTAVNLAWAIDRVLRIARNGTQRSATEVWAAMLEEAHAISREEADASRRIGEHGAGLIREGAGILTHCNAGALATVAYGTALAPLYVARAQGRRFRVFADETRPLLQGARLTAFELASAGIDVTVLCDGAAASLMSSGQVNLVVVGADRIARNGDVANKIGTLSVAIAAKYHNIPFYVAAPMSTFDPSVADGRAIPIEQRSSQEVSRIGDRDILQAGVRCDNRAFDVTPAELIRAYISDLGIFTAEELPARLAQNPA
jgi:methylthioribose-1-phosphate isomerase